MTRGLLLACLLGGGCVAVGDLGKDGADEAGGEGTGTAEAGSGEGGSESGSGDGSSDGGRADVGRDVCDPEQGDTPCVACQKHACCDLYDRCRQDDRCICILVCREEGHGVDACLLHCGDDGGEHSSLLDCMAQSCADSCP